MKGAQQKKLLKKEAALAGIAIIVAIMVVTGVSYFQSSIEEEVRNAKTSVSALQRKKKSLTDQFAKAKNSLRLYETIVQNNSGEDFSLNRETATSILNDLNERYRLSNLSVSISPIRELKNSDSLKSASSVIIYSEVVLKFDAISDELVMGFVNTLTHQFLGYVNILEFSMTKESAITGEVLYGVSKGKKPATVSGALKFLWLGLKLDEPVNAAGS